MVNFQTIVYADFESYQFLVLLFVKIEIMNSGQSLPRPTNSAVSTVTNGVIVTNTYIFDYNRLGSASLDTNLQIQ